MGTALKKNFEWLKRQIFVTKLLSLGKEKFIPKQFSRFFFQRNTCKILFYY